VVRYAGPGGDAELAGLSFADAGQHLEHRLLVDHAVPHCKSNVVYKAALQGAEAHTVWIGDVLIRAAAEGTQTFELNRNLLLTQGARPTRYPTWRSRPARSRAPGTPARPAGSTTSSCSTCGPEAFRRRSRAGWWCAASSTRSSTGSPCRRSRERLEAAVEHELAMIES